jgi:hypothetical protein
VPWAVPADPADSDRGAGVNCPWCGVGLGPFDGQEPGDEPVDGDVTICARCVCWSVFVLTATGLRLRRANSFERDMIMARPDFLAAYNALMDRGDSHQAVEEWRKQSGEQN